MLKESFNINIEINKDREGIKVITNLDATRNRAHASLRRYLRRGSFNLFFNSIVNKIIGINYSNLLLRIRRVL